ncbi:MAG: antitoxin [Gammaproteobacteria bacterium]|nr:antitoxin [Gammaproteobacteria bacterium]MDE0366121.1 antitoxin [Gammaproteobacteria bacterium]
MKNPYDFSKLVKNPYLRKPKQQLTTSLDVDAIDYFLTLAGQSGIPYQSLINLYLQDCVAEKKTLRLEWAS